MSWVLCLPAWSIPITAIAAPNFERGVSLGLFSIEPGLARLLSYGDALEHAAAVGADHIQLVFRFAQDHRASDSVRRHPEEALTDEEFLALMAGARAFGLKVDLMPIVHVRDQSDGAWRGNLAPLNFLSWWHEYRALVLHYADLAEAGGASRLSVGSELKAFSSESLRWRTLIEDVRQRFSGAVTYSANWDHYQQITFWDAVDVISVNAYWPLTETYDPTVEVLGLGWDGVKGELLPWLAQKDRPLVFSEVGYRADEGAARYPWQHGTHAPPRPEIQARCYRAFHRAWHGWPGLQGVYFWNFFHEGGLDHSGFSPRNKPAEDVITLWFNEP